MLSLHCVAEEFANRERNTEVRVISDPLQDPLYRLWQLEMEYGLITDTKYASNVSNNLLQVIIPSPIRGGGQNSKQVKLSGPISSSQMALGWQGSRSGSGAQQFSK